MKNAMEPFPSILLTLTAVSLLSLLPSCMVFHMSTQVGIPLDRHKIALIEPGATHLAQILEWFGPPDYIIDGTQQMPDVSSGMQGTRTLTAPEGTVILIYTNMTHECWGVGSPGGVIQEVAFLPNELAIILSKNDHTVVDKAIGYRK